MKKLLLLMLVLMGCLSTANADELTTVYLKPGTNWSDAGARFALYMFDSTNGNTADWFSFINISDGLYYALFNKTKYDKMILCRMNPNNATNSFESTGDNHPFWNKSADLNAPSTSAPVYTISGDTGSPTVNTGTIEASGNTIHKIYVQDKENTGQTPHFYEYQNSTWYAIDNAWPGAELTTEVLDDATWYVFKTLKTSVLGRFMQAYNNSSNFEAGGFEFDLSSGNLFYNYYPSLYECVQQSDALSEAANIYFRTNAETFDPTKCYFWNCEGINTEKCFSIQTVNGYSWKKITTHKPTFNIQFYAGDGGNEDGTKTDNAAVTCVSGETAYYMYRLSWGNNSKMDSKYYIIGTDNDNGGNNYLAKLEMENLGNFVYKATIDNVSDTKDYYIEIAPVSALNEDKTVNDYAALIYSTNWDYEGPIKNPYAFTTFEEQSASSMRGKGYNRWKISQPFKYDICYNFATAKMTIVPSRTTTIGSAGYTTWSNGEKFKVSGATAYTVTDMGTYARLNEQSADIVYPAGTGLILGGSGEVTISAVAPDAEAASMSGNDLLGSGNSSAAISAGSYVLYWNGSDPATVGFKQTTAGTLAAHKAYLPAGAGAPEFLGFNFGDMTPTDINSVKREEIKDKSFFNLAGQRVANPTKGLYIVNGKKVMIK